MQLWAEVCHHLFSDQRPVSQGRVPGTPNDSAFLDSFCWPVTHVNLVFRCSRCSRRMWNSTISSSRLCSLAAPEPDEAPKEYPEKIKHVVDEISKMTLIEVAELNDLLKVMHMSSACPRGRPPG